MNKKIISEVAEATQAGNLIFPEVVRRLTEAGVESYLVDLVTGTGTFFSIDGASHVETMILPHSPVAADFSQPDIVTAIRGAQADTIRYPEFIQRSTAAGVIAYWVFLTGRKVIYFGRKGEQHVENFPTAHT